MMNLKLGFFRFLTISNIVVLALEMFGILLQGWAMPALLIIAFLLLLPAFIHNTRCLRLQRYFLKPGTPVDPRLPMLVNLSSIGAFIYGILLVSFLMVYFRNPDIIQQAREMQHMDKVPDNTLQKVQLGLTIFHATTILLNCIISVQFSRRLRDELPEEKDNRDSL
ncbi:hypothetical protein MKQ68_19295 [Chitinophaga horti]|uniref:DUF4199 domain-containing protein n=1 Tax=Chitinophaga horti TaxID=2920382 RepID=A0ABY6IXW3_9BACT|nr:hypothetical protein [Chitinophaga horti]UYQ92235.1 hypothetical protein MKQ68_19295 [Chitinophaga horti]